MMASKARKSTTQNHATTLQCFNWIMGCVGPVLDFTHIWLGCKGPSEDTSLKLYFLKVTTGEPRVPNMIMHQAKARLITKVTCQTFCVMTLQFTDFLQKREFQWTNATEKSA